MPQTRQISNDANTAVFTSLLLLSYAFTSMFVLTYSYIHSRSFSHSAPLSIAVLPSFSLAFDGYLSILLYLCKLKRRKNNDSLYSRET